MGTLLLDEDEIALWHAFKRAAETVRARVAAEITRETGLSDADFGIVTRLDDAGGRMRQNELAASMGWHRSRLSHQLTRMIDRDLVRRLDADGKVTVEITDTGRAAAARARPVHAAAVREKLIALIPPDQRDRLIEILRTLAV
ncbi:DNA-binding transcriptional regulator, MarR family [Streptosporangium subroseum]|uniref:DNA-binding transcriptional regulator, MarR family n=1 Tax=Streptosporangium subroseum TaxID=106412 RepID=A0A239P1K3_9ACTN|nr:MarR family winged helix-turn-helix transcriptional regulator [Streptosporangium subroseum]SNT60508.1 DNA-binding transcriptional regulator, MarR family [Streptosporangium subroseum]